MPTPEPDLLLLLLLGGLLLVVFEIPIIELGKEGLSSRHKCLSLGLAFLGRLLLTLVTWLISTPKADRNMNFCYWTLGIGYAFALLATVILLINKLNTDKLADACRTQLLKAVQEEVTKRLSDSLYKQLLIDLLMENQPERVGLTPPPAMNSNSRRQPSRMEQQRSLVQEQVSSMQEQVRLVLKRLRVTNQLPLEEKIAPEENIIYVFNRKDIAGKLLILGEPGK